MHIADPEKLRILQNLNKNLKFLEQKQLIVQMYIDIVSLEKYQKISMQ